MPNHRLIRKNETKHLNEKRTKILNQHKRLKNVCIHILAKIVNQNLITREQKDKFTCTVQSPNNWPGFLIIVKVIKDFF